MLSSRNVINTIRTNYSFFQQIRRLKKKTVENQDAKIIDPINNNNEKNRRTHYLKANTLNVKSIKEKNIILNNNTNKLNDEKNNNVSTKNMKPSSRNKNNTIYNLKYISQKSDTNNNINVSNNPNVYINKLHDYLDISNKSENEKVKINKLLNKLKTENLSIHVILNSLKNLCSILLKKNSIDVDKLIVMNYVKNKNSLKRFKNYFQDSFVHIENYLTNYICFINEDNIFELYKYFYYLNYPLNLNTHEVLQEKLYLHIDKLDNLKTIQIYYIIRSFYEHFYLKQVDSFLTLVVNEKLQKYYEQLSRMNNKINNNGNHIYNDFPNNGKYINYTFNNLFNSNDLIDNINNTKSFISDHNHNNFMNYLSNNNINFTNPNENNNNNNNNNNSMMNENKEKYINDNISSLHYMCDNNLKNEEGIYNNKINVEDNEIILIFKYIQNYHDNMDFFYNTYITNFIQTNRTKFSIDTLLLILNIYIKNIDELFNKNILDILYYNIEDMTEDNLLLFTEYLKKKNKMAPMTSTTIANNDHNHDPNGNNYSIYYYNYNDSHNNNNNNFIIRQNGHINKITQEAIFNKIMNKIKKDKDLILPNNLALLFLNLHEIINKGTFNTCEGIIKPQENVKNENIMIEQDDSYKNCNDEICDVNNGNIEKELSEKSCVNVYESTNNITEKNILRGDNKVLNRDNDINNNNNNNINNVTMNTSIDQNSQNIQNNSNINMNKNLFMKEFINFCDEYCNNINNFSSILDLYLIYIKNESVQYKTMNTFEKKIKINKNKLSQEDISNIILSLSIYPHHNTQMLNYLENLINEKLIQGKNYTPTIQNDNNSIHNNNVDVKYIHTNNTNYLIDISLALGISGRNNLKLWNYIDVDKIILTCNKKLLLYLSYSFLLTNYVCPISWFFIIRRIVEDVKIFNKKQCELIYEILKCTVLFNYIDLNNFSKNVLHITDSNTKKGIALSQLNYYNKKENNNFLKSFHYLLNTSYYHYKMKLLNNQYVSKVPYEDIFIYLKLNYEKNVEFKQLYIIPYLLKDYNVIIDPLPTTPIHKSSGYIMGEIQLKHKVFQNDNYVVLSFFDGMWNEFINPNNQKDGEHTYNIKLLAEHFKSYVESHIKIKINKNYSNNNVVTNNNKTTQNNTINTHEYLKFKKSNNPPETNNNKYLINKTNNMNNYTNEKKYLKTKKKIINKKE
ncbi:hypothetical protein PGSY75_1314000 [Plasmodium gaboni]|uniref:Uncharacterized protein n=1 Tax=Plasmodium gaboni TaxID=647221 RepID=A0A151LDC8_9APIC|nr:hypothetical protein PGSY75_1314000 [Plasmodium gaboni]KYN96941.1 hypothetical protein PGSY75_1314000 [Plasmodium gaboni]